MRVKELPLKFWKKLPPLKKARDIALNVVTVVLLLSGLTVVCTQAPSVHTMWLRHSVGSSVFMIVMLDESGNTLGGGTGFEGTAPSGVNYIMTNAHVCEVFENGSINVKLHDGRIMPRRILERS